MIDITGLDRVAVIQALYAASRPLGMGFLRYKEGPLDEQEASQLVGRGTDYVHGRPMKVEIKADSDVFEEKWYDLRNKPGAAARAIAALRAGDMDALHKAHIEGVQEAIADARGDMSEDNIRVSRQGKTGVIEFGLPDIPELADALKRAEKATQGEPPRE